MPYWLIHLAAVLGPTRDAGQVVAGLAHERGDVGIVVGRDGVLLLDGGRGHAGQVGDALAGIEHRGLVGDELEGVTVTGADQHLHAGGLGARRQRADDVVGLEAFLLERRDVQRVEDLLDQGDLTGELRRRLGAVALVFGVLVEPERLAGDVERDGHVRRLLVTQHVDQHRREAEHRIGALTRRGREVLDREGEEGTVGDGMAVDQQEAVHPVDSSRRV